MQNLDHLNWEALGFMVKLSTYNPPLLQHQHRQFCAPPQPGPVVSSCSARTHSQATSTPSTDAALSTSNSRTQACTATASSTASDRTTHHPTAHSTTATGTEISKTPVVHVNQQTTRSGQVVRLPQKYKDFVLS